MEERKYKLGLIPLGEFLEGTEHSFMIEVSTRVVKYIVKKSKVEDKNYLFAQILYVPVDEAAIKEEDREYLPIRVITIKNNTEFRIGKDETIKYRESIGLLHIIEIIDHAPLWNRG